MERQPRVPGVVAKSARGADRSGKYRQADPVAVAPESVPDVDKEPASTASHPLIFCYRVLSVRICGPRKERDGDAKAPRGNGELARSHCPDLD
jgi:hypothetical protein